MTAYITFKTICMKCNKKLTLAMFNVQIGLHCFALCPKHEEEVIKLLNKWGVKLT